MVIFIKDAFGLDLGDYCLSVFFEKKKCINWFKQIVN